MKKDSSQLDELFRSRLDNFEQEPPSYIWSRIQEQQARKKRRVLFFYLKGAGVAAAVLLAFLLGWQIKQNAVNENMNPGLAGRTEQHEGIANELDETVEPEEAGIQSGTDQTNEDSSRKENAVFASEYAQDQSTKNKERTEEISKNNGLILTSFEPALSQDKQLAEKKENRKQETEKFRLLQLLGINLDDSYKSQAQLVEMKKARKEEQTTGLNRGELALVENNARLLAENKEDEDQGSWQLSAMLAPGYSVNQSSQTTEYASDMANPAPSEDLQLGGGISVEYKTNKKWSVQSGIYYSKLGQTSSNQTYRTGGANYLFDNVASDPMNEEVAYFNTSVAVKSGEMLMNTAAGVVALDNLPSNAKLSSGFESVKANEGILLTATEFKQDFEYIEIPLILRYQLIDATFSMQLLGGFNTSILVANNAYASSQYGREKIGETRDMNSVNYSTSFGFGLGYGISDRISLRLEPQLKYFLGSLNSNASVSFKPYTFGVYTGVSYQF